jgi:hypothetical protein
LVGSPEEPISDAVSNGCIYPEHSKALDSKILSFQLSG